MYKKSITRIENENESSQADLSSPAMHDIIATNHVVLAKVSHFFIEKKDSNDLLHSHRNHIKNVFLAHVKP